MAKIDALRKIIREEVRAVFQEELAGILKEAVMSGRGQRTITEETKPRTTVPATLNKQPPKLVPPILSQGNPLNSLLQETAMSMTARDYEEFGGSSVSAVDPPVVGTVDGMVASARKSSNFDAIEINAVPDFTDMMSRMKASGEI